MKKLFAKAIPKPANLRKGSDAETWVAQYLTQQGWQILAQNFTCKGGELDLIALKNHQLHFIEVKARQNADFGAPEEFVTPAKQQRLQKCAQTFLQKYPAYHQHSMQFDVITLLGTTNSAQPPQLNWIQNAFGGL